MGAAEVTLLSLVSVREGGGERGDTPFNRRIQSRLPMECLREGSLRQRVSRALGGGWWGGEYAVGWGVWGREGRGEKIMREK